MSIYRKNAKRDANEAEIVYALEQAGATVSTISAAGVPDLLVGFRQTTYLIEVKDGRNKLNEVQAAWHEHWRGAPVGICYSIEQALKFIGAMEPEWRGAN